MTKKKDFRKKNILTKTSDNLLAKKSYGQHFLKDATLCEDIANSLVLPEGCNNVLEIGPGTGALTKFLMDKPFNFKAIDADADMIAYQKQHYPIMQDKLIEGNFLNLDFKTVFNGEPFCIIGNFPYNISSQILIKILDFKEYVPIMIGMFQKEVGERVITKEGRKAYGILSLFAQIHYDGSSLFDIKPDAFDPPPKVDSIVIKLTRKENNVLPCNELFFREVVKAAFNQRRKMLRNTLEKYLPSEMLKGEQLYTMRPEQLSVNQFLELVTKIEKLKSEI